MVLLLSLPFNFAVSALAVSFLWSAYRLANAEERSKILWIVLGASFAVAWIGFLVSLVYAGLLTDILDPVSSAIWDVSLPVLWFTSLGGFAMAILYSGAFDVRPLINKTTVYGTLGVLGIILFATIESLVSEVVEARLGLPDMAGAGVSGALVAGIILALRGRFSRGVSRLLRSTDDRSEEPRVHEVG
ncbi:MAG: hypothetical protein IH968_15845 [Gemmatimonadetes bacterium]|nr:hypothetical protein [Gemmatimonadota bacterium]